MVAIIHVIRSYLAEHYVFPDETPAEDQREVRTIEEESLFRVAYPEVVEKYLKEKEMAEEEKTRSKTRVTNPRVDEHLDILYFIFSVF